MKKKKLSATSDDHNTDDDRLSEDDNNVSSGVKKCKCFQPGKRSRKKVMTATTCTQANNGKDLANNNNKLLIEDDVLRTLEKEGLDIDENNINFTHKTNDEEDDSKDELNAGADAYNAKEINTLVAKIEVEYLLPAAKQRLARYTVTKLVELAKRVFHLPTIHADLKSCCIKERTHDLQMICAIATRWNSFLQAIERALKLRVLLTRLLLMPKYNKKGKKELARFQLSKKEWNLLEQLHAVLMMFLRAMDRVSRSNIPLVHEVIPVIDIIMGKLFEAMINIELFAQICYGTALGYRLLNKYYSIIDNSILYRCAMILHPKYKLDYFRNQKWKVNWIAAAVKILHDECENYYKPKLDETALTSASQSQNIHDDPFACLDTYTIDGDSDVLDNWLKTPTYPTCTDPLLHWEN
ncbi:hypothetical protein PsYK624_164230 [Phanerochaete sordida]|uniref:Uncharacterized protein n=1 Tax=Phanerochaete sordida TaxID=48140 RepID=A0A9P3GQT3_9APHY|nr:hypothetical protein PsYK624_164230 [Phanerochaete sordida]